jgi:hypothetical protein
MAGKVLDKEMNKKKFIAFNEKMQINQGIFSADRVIFFRINKVINIFIPLINFYIEQNNHMEAKRFSHKIAFHCKKIHEDILGKKYFIDPIKRFFADLK